MLYSLTELYSVLEHDRRGLMERMPQSGKSRGVNGSAAAAAVNSAGGGDSERAASADLLGNAPSIFSLGENLSSLAVGFGAGVGEMPDLLASDSGTSISSAPSGGSNKALTSSAQPSAVSHAYDQINFINI